MNTSLVLTELEVEAKLDRLFREREQRRLAEMAQSADETQPAAQLPNWVRLSLHLNGQPVHQRAVAGAGLANGFRGEAAY